MANEVKITVSADDRATPVLQKAQQQAGMLSGAFKTVAATAAGFVIGGGVARLPSLLSDMTKAAAEDAASITRLQQAVTNTGDAWSKHASSMETVIKRGQELAFSDEQTRSGLAILTAQTDSAVEAQRRYALAMDLARGANIDVVTASRLLGKVTDENVSVLQRYGITVRKGADETELFGAISEKFSGQAQAFAESEAGRMAIMADKVAEAREAIGRGLLPIQLALASALTGTVIPAAEVFVGALGKISGQMAVLGPLLAGAATIIGVSMIPKLVALTVATWGHVAALAAQAIAFAAANPAMALAALAAGATVAAFLALSIRSSSTAVEAQKLAGALDDVTAAAHRQVNGENERVTAHMAAVEAAGDDTAALQTLYNATRKTSVSYGEMERAAHEADVALMEQSRVADNAADAINRVTSATEEMTSAQRAAAIAAVMLTVGQQSSADGMADLNDLVGVQIERLREQFFMEQKLAEVIDDLTRDFVPYKTAKERASDATRAAAEGERAHKDALAELKKAMQEAKQLSDELAASFAELGDRAAENAIKIGMMVGAAGGGVAEINAAMAEALAAERTTGTQRLLDAFNRGSVTYDEFIRSLSALQTGTPDPLAVRLGEVPALQHGGIVTKPTLAMIGEGGPEAVVPLGSSGAGGTINIYGDIYGFDDFQRKVAAAWANGARGGAFRGYADMVT